MFIYQFLHFFFTIKKDERVVKCGSEDKKIIKQLIQIIEYCLKQNQTQINKYKTLQHFLHKFLQNL